MGKTVKKDTSMDKYVREVKKYKEKYEQRKEQVARLKHIIRELEKDKEKLTEELKCYKAGVEYKPKDIAKKKKLTKEEKDAILDKQKLDAKEDLKKRLKEKYGRKNE